MIVGIMKIEIYISGSRSLKDKRKVIKSIKDKIRKNFNVSIAETDYQDKWQRSLLGISQVANDTAYIARNFDSIYQLLLQNYNIQVLDRFIDYV